MKSIALIAASMLCACRTPDRLPVTRVTERVRTFAARDSLSLTALIRVDTLKRISLAEVSAAATPHMRYSLRLDTLPQASRQPQASRLQLDVYNIRDSVRIIERDSVVYLPAPQADGGREDHTSRILPIALIAVCVAVLVRKASG